MNKLTLPNTAAARRALAERRPEIAAINKRRERDQHAARLRAKLKASPLALSVRVWLARTFPNCFARIGEPKRPLKIGIDRDVFALYQTVPGLGRALADYTHGKRYLAAMVAGAVRVDLDGNPAGIVSERDAADALARLAQIERREAELQSLSMKQAA